MAGVADRLRPVKALSAALVRPARRAVRQAVRPAVLGGFAVVLALAAAVTWWQVWQGDRVRQARDEALAVARDQVVAMLSYDAATVDADLAKAGEGLTGTFRQEFTSLAAQVVAPAAHEQQVTTRASVSSAGVSESTADRVVALMFVNQTTQSAGSQAPVIGGSRLTVTLERVDGRWLVSGVRPV